MWVSTGVLNGLFSEVHSVCALQPLDDAGASGLDLCLGLPKHNSYRWADPLQMRGDSREVQCGNTY